VIDEEFPYPPNSGKRLRSWNLLSRLARQHSIEVLCFGPLTPEAKAAASTASIVVHVVDEQIAKSGIALYADLFRNLISPNPYSVDKHYTRKFRNELLRLLAERTFDLIHFEWSPYVRYVEHVGELPVSVAAHNVESQIWKRRAEHDRSLIGRFFFQSQAAKMERFERQALRRANLLTTVSNEDARQLLSWDLPNVTVVENGVDVEYFRPAEASREEPGELLFLASLDWFPNQDALWYFVDDIFPLIRRSQQDVRLRVAGRRLPAAQAERLRVATGVEFCGELADVRPAYERAALVVVPLRIGGGSRLKILEAFAAGKAVVSTSIGAEGLTAQDQRDLYLADTPQEFARAVLYLLGDKAGRERLGKNGRALVEAQYSWEPLAAKMERAWRSATQRGVRR